MLDTLALVSSSPLCPLDLSRTTQDRLARVVQTFSTGEECLKALAYSEQGGSCVVLVDSALSDLAPLNLIDALRHQHPQISSVLMTDDPNPELIARAMLAGARATLPRAATESDLSALLRRFSHQARPGVSLGGSGKAVTETGRRASIVVLMSARGGAGKSTLATLLALLAGQADLDVALVDFDLQFGDMGFRFGATGTHTLVDLAEASARCSCRSRGFSEPVADGVSLYAAASEPEQADKAAGQARLLLTAIAREHDLLIVDTGAFQILLHAELLDAADVAICLLDQTLAGIRNTQRLRSLCVRMGIPPARLLYVLNRAHSGGGYHPSVAETATILEVSPLRSIDDGGLKLAQSLDTGSLTEIMENGHCAVTAQVALVLDDIALATGLDISSLPHMRARMRREAKGRLRR